MYIPLTALSTLSLLLTGSALASRPHRRGAATVNSASDPDFMLGTNQTVSAWTRADCGHNVNGDENIFFPDLLYGKNNHALVVSYMLGRDLQANEQLDMSFAYPDRHSQNASDGTSIDWECALFQFTASPDPSTTETLKANTCYTPNVPVTCFNLWRTE
ncbi:MAG: hypothetical protein Q9161_002492 [Pseudevernia consocians]